MHFKAALAHLAVRTSPQTGRGRKVKVGKCDVGDSEPWGVGGLDTTSLGVTRIDGCVRYNEGVLAVRIQGG